jgi:recombination protein RecT
MTDQIQKNNKTEMTITAYMNNEAVRRSIEQVLGDRTNQFVTSVASLVTSNSSLTECDKKTLMSACLTAAALNLPINQNLGFAYIIAYNNRKKTNGSYTWVKEAQFQMGYKGFIQLAMRSNQYKLINVSEVRDGEIKKFDRLTGEIKFKWIDDKTEREKAKVIGYVAYLKLKNGFSKTLYMTNEELEKHGTRYSKMMQSGKGLWKDDFDAMAKKTVIKLLISKWGIMTTELETAQIADQAIINDDGYDYPDNKQLTAQEQAEEKERNRIIAFIESVKTVDELRQCDEAIVNDEGLRKLYAEKEQSLKVVVSK